MNPVLQTVHRRFLSTMVKARVFMYVKAYDGPPQESNFQLVEEQLPPLKDGEFLVQAEYLSVDPYMRSFGHTLTVGVPFPLGQQIGRVAESKNPKFPVGKLVSGHFGWRTHTISSDDEQESLVSRKPYILPDLGKLPPTLILGILGMPAYTAYFGLLELVQPKEGETIVVSSAAGAVGSIAGQIAKIKGCKVIGIAGSKEKGDWLVKDLGFDYFINYKSDDIDKKLQEIAPDGVDGYFDNVAGDITKAVVKNMKMFGRIAVCGITTTHSESDPQAGYNAYYTLRRQLRIEGYNVHRWADRFPESFQQLKKWIEEGKLKYRENVTQGFENMPKVLKNLYKGESIGKSLVKV